MTSHDLRQEVKLISGIGIIASCDNAGTKLPNMSHMY